MNNRWDLSGLTTKECELINNCLESILKEIIYLKDLLVYAESNCNCPYAEIQVSTIKKLIKYINFEKNEMLPFRLRNKNYE